MGKETIGNEENKAHLFITFYSTFFSSCSKWEDATATTINIPTNVVSTYSQATPTMKPRITETIPTPTNVPESSIASGSIIENLEGRILIYNGELQSYQIVQSDNMENLKLPQDGTPVFAGFSASGVLAYAFDDPDFFLLNPDNNVRSISINLDDFYDLLPEDSRIWGWNSMQWINQDLLYAQLLYTTEPDQVRKSILSIVLTMEGVLQENLFQGIPDRLTESGVLFSPTLQQVIYAEGSTFYMKSMVNQEMIYTDKTFNDLFFSQKGKILEVIWSPDGRYAVYSNNGAFTRGIVIVDSEGNKQYINPEGYDFSGQCGFSWSSDSRYLTFVGADTNRGRDQFLYVYDVIEKRITSKIKTEEDLQTPIIQWSPYHLQFVISDWTYKGIYLYDLENGLKEQLVEKGKVFSWGK